MPAMQWRTRLFVSVLLPGTNPHPAIRSGNRNPGPRNIGDGIDFRIGEDSVTHNETSFRFCPEKTMIGNSGGQC